MTPCLCSMARMSMSCPASISRLLGTRHETQHGEIVAAQLLTLILGKGPAQGLLLLAHRRPTVFLEQILEAPLAERAAARATDLVDQAVGGEIEGIAVGERQGEIGESRIRRVAPVAQSFAIAFDLDHAFIVSPPYREPRAGKGYLFPVGLDEAHADLEPIVGLAIFLVLSEQALHATMQPG